MKREDALKRLQIGRGNIRREKGLSEFGRGWIVTVSYLEAGRETPGRGKRSGSVSDILKRSEQRGGKFLVEASGGTVPARAVRPTQNSKGEHIRKYTRDTGCEVRGKGNQGGRSTDKRERCSNGKSIEWGIREPYNRFLGGRGCYLEGCRKWLDKRGGQGQNKCGITVGNCGG